MRQLLPKGSEITLYEAGTDKQTTFTIREVIGTGASCIVYTADYTDGEQNVYTVRLKEFYPSGISITRNGTVLEPADERQFSELRTYFTSGYQKQLAFRTNPEQMNSISNVQGVYTGNHTKYIAMSCNNGSCIRGDEAFSFTDIMRIIAAVARQIRAFHQQGYLYLDLKPSNIFLYPESPDMVMLFDFDSVISKEHITRHSEWLSHTAEWSAPELAKTQLDRIDERTDIYAIGALLLYLLFKRKPELSDRQRFATWKEEIAGSILSEERPENVRMAMELLRKTLASSTARRYAACDELLEVIEQYIDSVLSPKPYLSTALPMGSNFFCGRDAELSEIHDRIRQEKLLILHGIGGIGKSELAKHYAAKHSEAYDAVIFMKFHNSIRDTLLSDSNFPIVNCSQSADETDDDYFERKLHTLQSICTQRHLLILDNFDTEACEDMAYLTGLPCCILITSRVDYREIFPQMDVGVISDFGKLREIFAHYYTGDVDSYADKIICALEGHTMGVELAARQMQTAGMTAEDMYRRISAQGLSAAEGRVRHFKDGSISSQTAQKHLEILFSVFGLSEELIYVLSYISMTGTTLITVEDFFEMCRFDEEEQQCFFDAETRGWVQVVDGKMQLHPLICEVLLSQIQPEIKDVWLLIRHLEEGADHLDELSGEKRFIHEQIMFHAAKHIKGEPVILVTFLRKMEQVFANYKDYAKAEECLLKRMELSEEIWEDSEEEYRFEYFALADYAKAQGAYDRAEAYTEMAQRMISEKERLTAAYYDSEDYEESIACAKQLLSLAETDDDYYTAYHFLAETELEYDGKKRLIMKYAAKELMYAKKILDACEEEEEQFELLTNIAEAYEHLLEYKKAVKYYVRAAAYVEAQDLEEQIMHHAHVGAVYAACREKAQAAASFSAAKQLVQAHLTQEHPLYFRDMAIIAGNLQDAFEMSEDTEYLRQKLEIQALLLETGEDEQAALGLHINMANALLMLEAYDLCEAHANAAMKIVEQYIDEAPEEMVSYLSEIWQLLYCCGDSSWESRYDQLMQLCREREWYEEMERNADIRKQIE